MDGNANAGVDAALEEDHWGAFDAALHMLDEPDAHEAGLAALTRHSATMSAKELLLKACEALSWYRAPLGCAYLLGRIEVALQQSADGGARAAQRVDEALQAITRCLCSDDDDGSGGEMDVSDSDEDKSVPPPVRDLSALYEPALRVVETAARLSDDWQKISEAVLQLVERRSHDMGEERLAKCARVLASRSAARARCVSCR